MREDRGKCTRLLVEIVVMHVKFHLSQDKISQSIVMTVFQIINQKVEVTEVAVEGLVIEELEDMAETTVVVVALEEIDHGKCTRLLVEIVVMNVKFHLSQDKISQSIVMTASKLTGRISCFLGINFITNNTSRNY